MHDIRHWIRLIEAGTVLPARLYHGTSSVHAEKIDQDGLIPQKSVDSGYYDDGGVPWRSTVYLTDDHRIAGDYAAIAVDRAGGTIVIYEITTSGLDLSKLAPDDYDLQQKIIATKRGDDADGVDPDKRLEGFQKWSEVPWAVSLATVHQVAYDAIIPLNAIRRL